MWDTTTSTEFLKWIKYIWFDTKLSTIQSNGTRKGTPSHRTYALVGTLQGQIYLSYCLYTSQFTAQYTVFSLYTNAYQFYYMSEYNVCFTPFTFLYINFQKHVLWHQIRITRSPCYINIPYNECMGTRMVFHEYDFPTLTQEYKPNICKISLYNNKKLLFDITCMANTNLKLLVVYKQ